MALKALNNPPDILPEHESMQDYIEIIDQEGLLKKKSDSSDSSKEEVISPKKIKHKPLG